MTDYELRSAPQADLDVGWAFAWYEHQRQGLGVEFIDELHAAYNRIAARPLAYQNIRSGVRRALLRRFPYAVYFTIEKDAVVVIAALHVSRNPAEWQRRRG